MTLIGATTENPYFEVNSALLSRVQIYELQPLGEEELRTIVTRGAAALEAEVPAEVAALVARRAGGDARNALNILELAAQTARAEGSASNEQHVEDAARKRPLVYDKGGDAHYDFISAFIKSMRGSDPDAAVYYLAAMLEGGEDARFIARRMIVLASEDIGNADPRALLVAVAAAQAVEHVGLPGGAAEPRAGRDLPRARAEVERVATSRSRRRPPTCASSARPGRPTRSATRTTAARRSSAAARATSTRTTTRAASTPSTCPRR